MARLDELRLMAKVARLYHGDGLRQSEITDRLNIHQSTVSRLLKRAEKEGIVRITLTHALGSASGARGRAAVGLRPARSHRRRCDRSGRSDRARPRRRRGLLSRDHAEGRATSSASRRGVRRCWRWSRPCTRARAPPARTSCRFSAASATRAPKLHATQLTRRLANLLGGVATLLPAPGAVGSADARRVMLKDRYVQEATALFKSMTRRARRHRRGDAVEAAGGQRQRLLRRRS